MKNSFPRFACWLCVVFSLIIALIASSPLTTFGQENKVEDKGESEKESQDEDDDDPKDEDEEDSIQSLMEKAGAAFSEGDYDKALKIVREAMKGNPDNIQVKFALISILQQMGMKKAGEDRKSANPDFFEAAKVARGMLEDEKTPPPARAFLANAIYNEACSFAVEEKAKEAIDSLKLAIESGYDDFDQIDKDSDFDSIRDREDFKQAIEDAKKAIIERMKAETEEEMKEFESFDFDFALKSVDGDEVKMESFKGKVLIVDIWGTWCPPCRAEIPSFIKLVDKYKDQGLAMVGLNYEHGDDEEENIEKIKEFIEENKINYPCLLGDEATQEQVPDFQGYPTTLFIGADGKVKFLTVGLHPYEKLESIVTKLLEEKK